MSLNKRLMSSAPPPLVASENFKAVLYTGNSASDNSGTTQSITGVGFKPDFVWIKRRDGAENHYIVDSSRGSTKMLLANTSGDAEFTQTNAVTSFNTDGFTVSGYNGTNNNGETYVAWCWKSGGGTTSSNTDGSITSTVQANKAAGFSIVTLNSGGSNGNKTAGHGLGVKPAYVLFRRTDASAWFVYHKGLSDSTKYLYLQDNYDEPHLTQNTRTWGGQDFNTTQISWENGWTFSANEDLIAYCWAEVEGFSKFGGYTGNDSSNIIETGFEPAYLMVKGVSDAGDWIILDNKRNTSNPRNTILRANLTDADLTATSININFLSNGFELTTNNGDINANNQTYIYIAYAADPDEIAPTLVDSFNIQTWTGTGSARPITGLGFSPNFVWYKERSSTSSHELLDTLRGPTNYLMSAASNAQASSAQGLQSFDSDGFSVGTDGAVNQSNQTYVGWAWKADDNEPTINDNGSNIDSITSVNSAAGFSIVQWTGTGNAAHTVGHGLSATPEWFMMKDMTEAGGWNCTHVGLASDEGIGLSSTGAAYTSMGNNGGIIKSNLGATTFGFTAGAQTANSVNKSGNKYIAYCFHSVTGYSKFGTYEGNGSALGNVVALGFEPDFLMVKRTDSSSDWAIADTARDDNNYPFTTLEANRGSAEITSGDDRMYSEFMPVGDAANSAGGFRFRNSDGPHNVDGGTYIYIAFKMNPSAADAAGKMAFLVIGGGGAGGGNSNSGGGGAGGLRTSYGSSSGGGKTTPEGDIDLLAGTYTITVGAGGAGGPVLGNSGSASSIAASGLTTISAAGGGGGAGQTNNPAGAAGGSGGGGGYNNQAGGAGSADQGFAGGAGVASDPHPGGGGGGAGEAGNTDGNGTGGDGLAISITGSSVTYAGGGSGGVSGGATVIPGSAGGGGAGAEGDNTAPGVGTANLGSGGGGGAAGTVGAAGGKGVVILRLLTSEYSGSTTGSPAVTTSGSSTIIKFTSSGTYVHS